MQLIESLLTLHSTEDVSIRLWHEKHDPIEGTLSILLQKKEAKPKTDQKSAILLSPPVWDEYFIQWSPKPQHTNTQTTTNTTANSNVNDFALPIAMKEINYIKKFAPTVGKPYIVVIDNSGYTYPSFHFKNSSSEQEFFRALKQHVRLNKTDAANVFQVEARLNPLELLRSSLSGDSMPNVLNANTTSTTTVSNASTTTVPFTPAVPVAAPIPSVKAPIPQKFGENETSTTTTTTTNILPPVSPLTPNSADRMHQNTANVKNLPVHHDPVGEFLWSTLETFARVSQFTKTIAKEGLPISNPKRPQTTTPTEPDKAAAPLSTSPNTATHTTSIGSFEIVDNETKKLLAENVLSAAPTPPNSHDPNTPAPTTTLNNGGSNPSPSSRKIQIPEINRTKALTPQEWNSFFNENGSIKNKDSVFRRVFSGGVDPSIRKEVWTFMLNLYPWESTREERVKIAAERTQKYENWKAMTYSVANDSESHFTKLRSIHQLIGKDVPRTDRSFEFFRDVNGPNLKMLSNVLNVYALFNFDIGYVQGMSDLLAPILYVMGTEWEAFWCFKGLMDRLEVNFYKDQSGMTSKLSELSKIVKIVDPRLYAYLESKDCLNFYFCFRWVLLDFKREFTFSSVSKLWEILWSGNQVFTPHFVLFMAASLLIRNEQHILQQQLPFDEILKLCNELSEKIDLDMLIVDAERLVYVYAKQLENNPSANPGSININDNNNGNTTTTTSTTNTNTNTNMNNNSEIKKDSPPPATK